VTRAKDYSITIFLAQRLSRHDSDFVQPVRPSYELWRLTQVGESSFAGRILLNDRYEEL
jgi:hypothetical protein